MTFNIRGGPNKQATAQAITDYDKQVKKEREVSNIDPKSPDADREKASDELRGRVVDFINELTGGYDKEDSVAFIASGDASEGHINLVLQVNASKPHAGRKSKVDSETQAGHGDSEKDKKEHSGKKGDESATTKETIPPHSEAKTASPTT